MCAWQDAYHVLDVALEPNPQANAGSGMLAFHINQLQPWRVILCGMFFDSDGYSFIFREEQQYPNEA